VEADAIVAARGDAMAKAISSLVVGSSASALVAFCAMAENVFITSATPSPA
jgi:hypothetical protein